MPLEALDCVVAVEGEAVVVFGAVVTGVFFEVLAIDEETVGVRTVGIVEVVDPEFCGV